LRFWCQLLGKIIGDEANKTVDSAQWGTQIVGDRVAEGFELSVGDF